MKLYLKPDVRMEPLIWNWYAWPHLIAPHTAAANIIGRHIKIMESYIKSPEIHKQANELESMKGGPFMDFPEENKVEEIKKLLEYTKIACKELIALNQDIKSTSIYLRDSAKGDSLEEFYQNLPNSLKGIVELVYDNYQNAHIRFIEPLLYYKYYNDKVQSVFITNTNNDSRTFSLSTPRLEKDKIGITLNIPFSSQIIDDIAIMRYQPSDNNYINSKLNLNEEQRQIFKKFFTEEKPNIGNIANEELRIRYFGHACILLETAKVSILIDPVISYSYKNNLERFTFLDLPEKIDYILITHNHQDHIMFETLLQLRHKTKQIVVPTNCIGSMYDPSVKIILNKIGFNNVITLDELETINFSEGKIISLPFLGEHGDLNIQTKAAYYINIMNKRFIFAADSNNLDPYLYNNIFSCIGKVEVVFIGMECAGAPMSWLYGPLLISPLDYKYDQKRRLDGSNAEKAWKIIENSGCSECYIYAMGQEPWLNYIMATTYNSSSPPIIESDKLVQQCMQYGIKSERLFAKKEWIYKL